MTIKVDLLPTERKRFTFDPMMGFLLVLIILCTVGFVLYGSKLQNDIELEKKQVVEIEEQIKQIEQNLPVIEDLKAQIAKLEDEIKVIESLVYDPIRYGNLLTEVGRVLPDNVWLSTLAIEPGTQSITMNGMAAGVAGRQPLATVAALMGNLDQSPFFTDASLSSTQQQALAQAGLIGFNFQIETHYNADYAALGEAAEQGETAPAPPVTPVPDPPAPDAAATPAEGSPPVEGATPAAGETPAAEAPPEGGAPPAEGGAETPAPAETPAGT